ncbi:MAG: adenosylmethionine decarboxylase [Candidatus Paceibacterota bacterium]
MSNHFGEHLTLDGYGGEERLLDSQETVLRALNELVDLLGMKILAEPQVYFAESNEIKDPGGWTGVVVIMESHISIHTFPKRGFVSADVYTCQNGLNTDLIISYFKKAFNLKDVETNFIKRGIKYPGQNIY